MLTVYRRHLRTCKSGHKEELRTSEFDERKKGWKRCECPIFASGTLVGKAQRRNTGQWEWEPARVVAAKWEKLGSWDGKRSVLPRPAPEPAATDRISIHDATESFIASCQNRGIAVPTLEKYKTFVKQLKIYAEARGYVMLDQLSVSDMDRFYASWKDAKRAKAKKLERLKAFVKFCINREWMAKDITKDLKAPEGSSIPANKKRRSPMTSHSIASTPPARSTSVDPSVPDRATAPGAERT